MYKMVWLTNRLLVLLCGDTWKDQQHNGENLFQFHGSNAHTQLTGDEGDIYNICKFKWYDWYYFLYSNKSFPLNKEKLGQVLDPERGESKEIPQWILKYNVKVVPRRSPRPLLVEEIHSATEQNKLNCFCRLTDWIWVTLVNPPPTSSDTKNKTDFE